MNQATASGIVAKLNLTPHPEGGFYAETFRDSSIVLSKSQLPHECKFLCLSISTFLYDSDVFPHFRIWVLDLR